MLSTGSIVIRVNKLERQTAFWQAALGYEPRHEPGDDFVILQPPGSGGTCISRDRVPAALQIPPRLHMDLYTDEQDAEVQRLLALGATRVEWSKQPAATDYVILADPEGNRSGCRTCIYGSSSGLRNENRTKSPNSTPG